MTDSHKSFETKTETKTKRRGNPNWVKGGKSPNEGGRPKMLPDLRAAARNYSGDALETLARIMLDREAPHSARVGAAREILDRGWGRAIQAVDVGVNLSVAESHANILMRLAEQARHKKEETSRVLELTVN